MTINKQTMKKRIKPIIILLSTLVIGIVLGFLVAGHHMHQRINKFQRWADPDGFVQMVQNRLDLTEEQREQVLPVIEKYANKSTSLRLDCHNQHQTIIDSMRQELIPYLNEDQVEKFDQCMNCSGKNCSAKKKHHNME